MKPGSFYLSLILTSLLFFSSCNKDDVPPVISLVGDANVELALYDSYLERGTSATDNEDGDISNQVVTTGTVNTSQLGTYTIRYNVNDAEGNAAEEVVRTVKVSMMQSNYEGSFSLTGNCPSSISVATNAVISAGLSDTLLIINPLTSNPNEAITVAFDSTSVLVPATALSQPGSPIMTGTGTLSDDAATLSLDLQFETASSTDNCTVTLNRL